MIAPSTGAPCLASRQAHPPPISRATPMQPPTCPKCSSVMESGFVIDKIGNADFSAPQWAEGVPGGALWTGLNLAGRERHAVVTYRCSACGYLESYAPSM